MSALMTAVFDKVGKVSGGKKFYRQLLDMQDVLYATAMGDDTEAKDRAACARAWEDLEDRKRIMRGRPLPGALRPEGKRTKRPRRAGKLTATVAPSPAIPTTPLDNATSDAATSTASGDGTAK